MSGHARDQDNLHAGEDRVRAIIDNLADAVFFVAEDGRIEHANPAAAALFGWRTEFAGRRLRAVLPSLEPGRVGACLAALAARCAGAHATQDLLARHADGSTFAVEATVSETSIADRRVFVLNVRDVTARRQQETLLRESEDRYRLLVEYAPEAIVVLDADSRRVVDVNDNALRLFGYVRAQMIDMAYTALSPDRQPDGSKSELAALAYLARTLAGESPQCEWLCRDAGGRQFPGEVRFVRFPAGNRNLIRVSIVDISARRESEDELRFSVEFERFLSDLCANLVENGFTDIDRSITGALGRICEFRRVERGCVYQFTTNAGDRADLVECSHRWGSLLRESRPERLLLDTELPWLAAKIRQMRVFHIADTATLPPEAWRERKRCQELGINSFAVVPMTADRQLVGFLLFESTRCTDDWPAQVLGRLRLVGDIFVSQLQHGRTADTRRRLMAILEATPDLVVMSDRSGGILYMNRRGREQLGLSAEQNLAGMSLADFCSGEDAYYMREAGLHKAVQDGAWQSTLQLESARGSRFPVSQITIAHRQDNSTVDYFSTVARDISYQQTVAENLRSKEEQLRLALAAARMGTWIWHIESNRVEWSDRVAQMFGIEPEDFAGTFEAYYSQIHPDDRELVEKTISRTMANGDEHYGVEHRVKPGAGGARWIECKGRVHRDGDGRPIRMIGTISDVSSRKRAEMDLFQEKERAQVTLQSIGDAVVTTDEHGLVEYLNPIAEGRLGSESARSAGKSIADVFDVIGDDGGQRLENPVLQCLREGRRIEGKSGTILRSRSGDEFAIQFSAAPIRDREGNIIGSVMVFHDVSRERSLYQRMSYQAAHDALTGLINRREFENRLTAALQTVWNDDQLEHTLLYIDLDQFKVVNDTCGHTAGDELLKRLTSLLNGQIRSSDCLARLGGDEFAVLLMDCPLHRAESIAESIRTTVNDFRFIWQDRTFSVSVSIGLVRINSRSESISNVLSAADVACYAAKDAGRNRVRVYRAESAPSQHKQMQWVSRIMQACEDDRLVLYYHPIVPLDGTPQRRHFELLLRMRDPYGKLVPPNSFIPAAERYNLMPVIDRWVVSHALEHLVQNRSVPPGHDYTLSINLSGSSLSDPHFLATLRQALEKHDYEPGAICFEITETAAISNLQDVVHFMHEIRKLGCSFSLDDFGSGLSSFAYLKDLPVDFLKIDRHFVRNIAADVVDHSMVAAINQVGHVMGLKTIAEGVECAAVLDKLKTAGVDFAQGFLFAEPAEASSREIFAPVETATILAFSKAETA